MLEGLLLSAHAPGSAQIQRLFTDEGYPLLCLVQQHLPGYTRTEALML